MAAIATLMAVSCKKKKDASTPVPPVVDTTETSTFIALKPGNYWIYQQYKLDSINGEAHALGIYDSCYVEKDTTVNSKVYHKYYEPSFGSSTADYSLLRDSLTYTVNSNGVIVFTFYNFADIFRTIYSYPSAAHPDTIRITEQMGLKNGSITVNAGTFITSAFRQIWHLPSSLPYGPTREYDVFRAMNIGIIRKTRAFYVASPEIYEARLERYHLQ